MLKNCTGYMHILRHFIEKNYSFRFPYLREPWNKCPGIQESDYIDMTLGLGDKRDAKVKAQDLKKFPEKHTELNK